MTETHSAAAYRAELERTQAKLDRLTEFHASFMADLLATVPACWAPVCHLLPEARVAKYLRHLEAAVGTQSHNLALSRHHSTCDGECAS